MGRPSIAVLPTSSKPRTSSVWASRSLLALGSLLFPSALFLLSSSHPPSPVPSTSFTQGPVYTTFTLSSWSYLVPHNLSTTLSVEQSSALRVGGGGGGDRLATVLRGPLSSCDDVTTRLNKLTERKGEDVWRPEFLEVLWLPEGVMSSADLDRCELQLHGVGALVQPEVASWWQWWRASRHEEVDTKEGPCLLSASSTGQTVLHPVYRLMDDTQQAFVSGVVPTSLSNSLTSFVLATGSDLNFHAPQIPVPFRLLASPTPERPLEGLRFGLKDIFDVAGTRTGCGSRAYASLYPPRNSTSPAIQRLVDLGAVLVGRTKTSQFANGESPTADWVDQFCPLNPRGDGYQDPGASSSGSAAAIAAYDWLDFTVGSDTGGSIRGPSGNQGVYGIRPSFGAISLEGVMPLAPTMDTAGWLARDPSTFERVGKAWMGDEGYNASLSLPKRLLVPSSIPRTNLSTEYLHLFDAFVSTLSSLMDVKEIETSSLPELWNTTSEAEKQGMDLDEFAWETYPAIVSFAQGSGFGASFRSAYQHAHNGSSPFISPSPLARWTWGLAKGQAFYDLHLQRQRDFGTWFDGILKEDEDSCSDGLMVYPAGVGKPTYRNEYRGLPDMTASPSHSFWLGRIGPLSGVPDMIFPIGQVPYNSTITGQPSMLPASVAVVARKGCDTVLLDLAKRLFEMGVLKEVRTGVEAF